jgi:Conjugal transfer protein
MPRPQRTLATLALSLSLCTGCMLHSDPTYPPALPAEAPARRWSNREPFMLQHPPPAELLDQRPVVVEHRRASLVPTDQEWGLWEAAPTPREICRGTGSKRTCVPTVSPSVSQAQGNALIRPTRRQMGNGGSATVTYTYQPGGIYLVEVAPHAGTILSLPYGQRLRIPPVLSKELFVTGKDDSPEEETVNDVVAIRAKQAPQRAVNVPLVFRSGLVLTLRLVTVEGDPMTLVQWTLPEEPARAKEIPVGDRPPKFDTSHPYTGYTIAVAGKEKLTPPWMPVAVADDGQNTLVKFERALDWTRAPVVVGMAQNGHPSITPNRYYTRPGALDEGAWLFVQGLWPAIRLKDSAGLEVQIVRTPPSQGDSHHAAR